MERHWSCPRVVSHECGYRRVRCLFERQKRHYLQNSDARPRNAGSLPILIGGRATIRVSLPSVH